MTPDIHHDWRNMGFLGQSCVSSGRSSLSGAETEACARTGGKRAPRATRRRLGCSGAAARAAPDPNLPCCGLLLFDLERFGVGDHLVAGEPDLFGFGARTSRLRDLGEDVFFPAGERAG